SLRVPGLLLRARRAAVFQPSHDHSQAAPHPKVVFRPQAMNVKISAHLMGC
ncbi:hypothetical protein BaRGS_00037106, partial [Batillaria attramentaria]